MFFYGPLHMAEQKQGDQLEPTYSSSVRIRDAALRTYQKRWTIGRSGERGSGISVLAAHQDDDDDDDLPTYSITGSTSVPDFPTFFFNFTITEIVNTVEFSTFTITEYEILLNVPKFQQYFAFNFIGSVNSSPSNFHYYLSNLPIFSVNDSLKTPELSSAPEISTHLTFKNSLPEA